MIRADITGRVARLAWPYVDSLSRTLPFAATVQASIDFERLVDRQRAISLGLAARATGHATRAQVLRRREEDDRRRLLADLRVDDEARLGSTAFWHESGSGPTLLLINGWTASGLMWPRRFVERLERSFRVVRIDNRGTGYSRSAPAPYTLADLADDAAAVLRVRGGGDPATVLGISMGGMIAQELAMRHPALVGSLILVATRPPSPAHVQAPPERFSAAFDRPAPGRALDDHFREMWGRFVGPGFVDDGSLHHELVGQIMRRPTPRLAVQTQVRAMASWWGSARLRSITARTTVVHGSADPLMPVGNGMRLARLTPKARYIELDGVGHLPPIEVPDRLADIVLDAQ
jgi:3-oxoadipate enol-lactonase